MNVEPERSTSPVEAFAEYAENDGDDLHYITVWWTGFCRQVRQRATISTNQMQALNPSVGDFWGRRRVS
jgi:hypothetical protein